MKHLTGWLSASAAPDNETDRQALIAEINRIIKPAQAATAETVFLGLLHAASNEVNVQGGCFDETELGHLAQLIVDVPVMIGHKKQELPIGRVFKAEVVSRNGSPWLRAYFYWHRSQAGADQLKAGIDAGIYRECSLGFLYGKPECAICGQDMRNCRHRINEPINFGGREIKAFYYYRKIEKVLEVSLVYRGAVAGTSVSTLAAATDATPAAHPFWRHEAKVMFDLEQLHYISGDLTVEPLYRGIWLSVTTGGTESAALMPSGQSFTHPVVQTVVEKLREQPAIIVCQLVAMRGSSRLPVRALLKQPGQVRARLIAFDLAELAGQALTHLSLPQRRELLADLIRGIPEIALAPAQSCTLAELSTRPDRFGTAHGLRLVATAGDPGCIEYRRKPALLVKLRAATPPETGAAVVGELRDGTPLALEPTLAPELLDESGAGIVWVEPLRGAVNRYRIVDLALGEAQPDSVSMSAAASRKHLGRFVLLLDNHGNGWLHLRRQRDEMLFKIAMLRLPLLLQGRRFWSARLDSAANAQRLPADVRILDRGSYENLDFDEKIGAVVTLNGTLLRDRFSFIRTKLSDHHAYLFSRTRTAILDPVIAAAAESEDQE